MLCMIIDVSECACISMCCVIFMVICYSFPSHVAVSGCLALLVLISPQGRQRTIILYHKIDLFLGVVDKHTYTYMCVAHSILMHFIDIPYFSY